ncbi:unnamed protein product [Soboliphyme baturini]|uniref:Uncharacterized protein n=1 Tax=Soboliphyme baturini TaxID=241478 RepID=A0A183IIL1_9BILA|nr:unnamed protein product [Soboliphyme baturini]
MVSRFHFGGNPFIIKLINHFNSCDTLNSLYFLHERFSAIHCLAYPFYDSQMSIGQAVDVTTETNASHLVAILIEALFSSKGYQKIGCLCALKELTQHFPPTRFKSSWFIVSSGKGIKALGLLKLLIEMMEVCPGENDPFLFYEVLFNLLGNLFCGCAELSVEQKTAIRRERFPLLEDEMLANVAFELLHYCIQILNMYWTIMQKSNVSTAFGTLTKGSFSNPIIPSVSRLKYSPTTKNEPKSTLEKQDQPIIFPSAKQKIEFSHLPGMAHLYETLQGAWSNYRNNLDEEVVDRFIGPLRAVLKCLCQILEVASFDDIATYVPDVLNYSTKIMFILPENFTLFIIQILKSLFGTNIALMKAQQTNIDSTSHPAFRSSSTLNVCCTGELEVFLLKMRTRFAQIMASFLTRHDFIEEFLPRQIGWFGNHCDRYVADLLQNPGLKAQLSEMIQLFQPVVVEALRLYNISVDVDFQCSVIDLLIHLLMVKVNYSALDPDHCILNVFNRQLEMIVESGCCEDDSLVSKIFLFFVLLHNETSKGESAVIEMPRLIQLAETLMTSESQTSTLGRNPRLAGCLCKSSNMKVLLDVVSELSQVSEFLAFELFYGIVTHFAGACDAAPISSLISNNLFNEVFVVLECDHLKRGSLSGSLSYLKDFIAKELETLVELIEEPSVEAFMQVACKSLDLAPVIFPFIERTLLGSDCEIQKQMKLIELLNGMPFNRFMCTMQTAIRCLQAPRFLVSKQCSVIAEEKLDILIRQPDKVLKFLANQASSIDSVCLSCQIVKAITCPDEITVLMGMFVPSTAVRYG